MKILLLSMFTMFTFQLHAESMIRLVCIDNLKKETDVDLPTGRHRSIQGVKEYGGLPEVFILLRPQIYTTKKSPASGELNKCFLVTNNINYKFLTKKSFYTSFQNKKYAGSPSTEIRETYTWDITRDVKLYTAGEVNEIVGEVSTYFSSDEYLDTVVHDRVDKAVEKYLNQRYRKVD